ncbi:MAG: hypothetical protein AAFX94_11800, partial [Myxococcota bacterium]
PERQRRETEWAQTCRRCPGASRDDARVLGSVANMVDGTFSGNLKSQAVLTAELQHMFQILKQLMELLSNMSKTMHDMAMVPIRNLR